MNALIPSSKTIDSTVPAKVVEEKLASDLVENMVVISKGELVGTLEYVVSSVEGVEMLKADFRGAVE